MASGLPERLASLAAVIVLAMVFGDDGLIFVTTMHDMVVWARIWIELGLCAVGFAVFMGGGVPTYAKNGGLDA